jgi:hypothetical protein
VFLPSQLILDLPVEPSQVLAMMAAITGSGFGYNYH